MDRKINVTIYNEFYHESTKEEVRAIYPQGIHGVLRSFLEKDEMIGTIRCATLYDHEEKLTQEVPDVTDVLTWWGHVKHEEASDAVIAMVHKRELSGMGLNALHSAHASKLMMRLLGTESYWLRWR